MKNCPKCNHSIEEIQLNCPKCGYQLISPDELREGLAALEKLANFYKSNLDFSPQGIKTTAVYIDNVSTELKSLQDLLMYFFEQHEAATKKPKLFREFKWGMNIKVLLMGIFAMMNGLENQKFSQKIISEPPHGCQGIEFELMKMRLATEKLAINYGNFIDAKDANGLEKSHENITELSSRINNAYAEMEKVVNQIKANNP
jgi:hypothetical protein